MFKFLKYCLLFVFILLTILIPSYIYFVKFDSESEVGRTFKDKTIRYSWLITALNLNSPGDYKYFYTASENTPIDICLVSVNGYKPDDKTELWMEKIVMESIGKKVKVFGYDLKTEDASNLDTNDINKIRLSAQVFKKADLYIVYAGSYSEKPSSVGLVLHRDTILIFKDALSVLSEKGYVLELLEKTTIMHEWGHLLGLEHIKSDNCIMNEKAEVYDYPRAGKNLPINYCPEEIKIFSSIKGNL